MVTILIVHGAWHIPEHYTDLVSSLKSKGFEVYYPRLTTSIDTLPIPKTASLANDRALIRSKIESLSDEGKKVIVLLHSYGGTVTTGCVDGVLWPQRKAQGLPGGVVHMIYVAAFAIPVGTCVNDAWGGGDNAPFLDYDTENDLISMKDPRNDFFSHVESDGEAEKWLDMNVLCPAQVNRETMESAPYEHIGKGVDATYLVCKTDKNLIIPMQEGMASLLGDSRRMEYTDAGHCAMIGYADTIADVTERAWEFSKERLSKEE